VLKNFTKELFYHKCTDQRETKALENSSEQPIGRVRIDKKNLKNQSVGLGFTNKIHQNQLEELGKKKSTNLVELGLTTKLIRTNR